MSVNISDNVSMSGNISVCQLICQIMLVCQVICQVIYQCVPPMVPQSGKIFVIAFVFDIMQFDYMLQFFLITVIGTQYYQRELLNLPAIGHLPAQSQW